MFDIGESYVQEMRQKHDEVSDERIKWHFIGHLQSNKVKYIVEWIHLIHAVDSIKLGNEISRCVARFGRQVDVLIEVNTSGEATHYGVPIDETLMLVKEISQLPNINVCGLMTMGPFLPDPEESRPAFCMLRALRETIEKETHKLPVLSMGMSNDFEVAIEEGATMIRIGTAIFGSRTTRN
ncbi:MAG: YggS family pyridoxal phosphate-dependent enzyme [Ignavibacteriales bacterium]|nr:YggS family pyridoxal phosphate-dependent enzyme [Ignavibacteriales bacterium]